MEHSQRGSDPGSSATPDQTRQPDRNAILRPLPPRPLPRTDSAERRPRIASPEQRPPSYGMATGSRYHTFGNTQSGQRTHDDLAARVLPQFRPRQSSSPTMSDILTSIPQWQPDEDVQKCPICEQDFTLFFRKHHCRKCGRVVCGECSRHRITVPLRYIAQPPWAVESALQYPGGALPVRVCNPCVPDPWLPPDNAEQPPPVPPPDTRPRPGFNRYSLPSPPPSTQGHMQRHSVDLARPPPYEYRQSDTRMHQRHGVIYRRPMPPSTASEPQQLHGRTQDQPHRIRFHETPSRPIVPPPRREVKEEDECPVCGVELPPGEATREAHITGCVTTRFGSLDTARTPTLASELAVGSEGSSTDPTGGNRTRAQSYRSRGLYQYTATEKDCIDGEGEEQECPICFEEFQPGATLGRLECLCRFHHKCIREWWVRKGPGMCPVHASHE